MEDSGVDLQLQNTVIMYFSDFKYYDFFLKYLSDASKKNMKKTGRFGWKLILLKLY